MQKAASVNLGQTIDLLMLGRTTPEQSRKSCRNGRVELWRARTRKHLYQKFSEISKQGFQEG
eukprot:4356717-Amphidinium_carterae.1